MDEAKIRDLKELHRLLTRGTARQRRELAALLAEHSITEEDLQKLTPAAMNLSNLEVNALIFAVDR